ncbi:MAG: Xaa-Pro aminopeptidase [Planctomycetota bacterium]|jgi:Xaa-Pro aminopeptidase
MYRQHRNDLLAFLRQRGVAAVIPTASTKTRNHDCEYRFRPTSDFWYLTGFDEPESVLVLLPSLVEGEPDKTVMYLRDRDEKMEIWYGRRVGVERAPDALDVDQARDIETVWETLPELLSGYETIIYSMGHEATNDSKMMGVLNELRNLARGGVRPPVSFVDHVPTIHEMRLIKSEAEIDLMRRAAAITTEAHVAAMAAAAPGVNECEIDALLTYTFSRSGSTGPAYTNIVAGGDNACILHYVENNMELKDGDLLLIDAGAEVDYYASDVTRTFPVNGSFNAEQRAIYELVLKAQIAGIEHSKPGVTFLSVHELVTACLVEGLIELGLLKGEKEELIESGDYRRFYMHKTGHWLGLDVHDCGYYVEAGESRKLAPGMVMTIEPGIYIAVDDETVEERWRGIGVRIEDDILITESGYENLTAAIPKEIDDVEAICQGREAAAVS